MALKAISIDDDPMATLMVKNLSENCPDLDLVNCYNDSIKGAAGIVLDNPDILLLDIEMPEFNGIQIMSTLKRPPKIIVISANPSFQGKALELDAVDFLQKPVEQSDFNKAVAKAKSSMNAVAS